MKVVIVGNGVAGANCALAVRQRDSSADITMIGGETDYFFSRTALMYAYMDMMSRRDLEPFERHAWQRQRINCVRGWVTDHDASARTVTVDGAKTYDYDRLVYAVGASANMFGWEGIDDVKKGVVHFISMQDLDECESLTPSTRRAVVVGGGLIGIELVECLRFHGVEVTFLVREPWYWPMAIGEEEADFVTRHMRDHGVDIRLSEEMTKVEHDAEGRVSRVHTSAGDVIDCQMLGVCAGVRPNVARLKEFRDPPPIDRGIVVNEFLQTEDPNIFAIGDCAQIHTDEGDPYIESIWYSAKRHGILTARNLYGERAAYRRPIFFNSSKFFEVEYTTVGDVMLAPEGSQTIYLKHPKRDLSVRIVHHDGAVIGFNMLGSRWDHEILERWVQERRDPEWVLTKLRAAQYDVEFGRAPLRDLVRSDLPLTDQPRSLGAA